MAPQEAVPANPGDAARPVRRSRRLDSANRSFFALVVTALVPYVLLGVFGCGLLSVAAYRLADDGLAGLNSEGQDLRPGVAFFAVVTGGTIAAAVSVRRQVRATGRLASSLRAQCVEPSPMITTTAERVGLSGRVDVVSDPEAFSFTYGLVRSRVAVSRGLIDALGQDELEAVLHHERYHVRNWDTLKMVVAKAAAAAFFFLPALRYLRVRYLASRELAADRQAFDSIGARPLTGALYRVLEQPAWATFDGAAALGGSEFLDLRVTQLETGDEPPPPRLPRWASALTAAGLLALSGAFLLTVVQTRGSTGMMGDSDTAGGSALAVLGAVACTATWVWLGSLVLRRVLRHNRL